MFRIDELVLESKGDARGGESEVRQSAKDTLEEEEEGESLPIRSSSPVNQQLHRPVIVRLGGGGEEEDGGSRGGEIFLFNFPIFFVFFIKLTVDSLDNLYINVLGGDAATFESTDDDDDPEDGGEEEEDSDSTGDFTTAEEEEDEEEESSSWGGAFSLSHRQPVRI